MLPFEQQAERTFSFFYLIKTYNRMRSIHFHVWSYGFLSSCKSSTYPEECKKARGFSPLAVRIHL